MNSPKNFYLMAFAAYAALGIAAIFVFGGSLYSMLVMVALFLAGAYWGLRYILLAPLREFQRTLRFIAEGNSSLRIDLNRARALQPIGQLVNSVAEAMHADLMRMKKLERMRSEFLGNVSHELRTPIFSMQGMIETLLNGAVDDPEVNRKFLRRALANAERLNRLLEDVIDISRVESGELKLKFRFFNVVPLIETVVDEMQQNAAAHNVALSWHAPAGQLEAYGDRERLRQVLVNLIDNALKYSGEGTSVTVSAARRNDAIEILVADTGVGIEAEHLTRIFERFYRIDKNRSRDVGGTGLGLAIAKHIVEAHHGSLAVSSTPGAGTVFTVVIPTSLSAHPDNPRDMPE